MKSLRTWFASPTFGSEYRFWTYLSPRAATGLAVTQVVTILVIALIGVPAQPGREWGLWLVLALLPTVDVLIVVFLRRRARSAQTMQMAPVVELPPPPHAEREKAAHAHGVRRRDAVAESLLAAAFAVGLALFVLGFAILTPLAQTTTMEETVPGPGTRALAGLSLLLYVIGLLLMIGGPVVWVWLVRGQYGRALVAAGEAEWRDALSSVTTPVSVAVDELRKQVEELQGQLSKTVGFSDDLESMLTDFGRSTDAQIESYAEMERKNDALQTAIQQGDASLALTLSAVDEQREKNNLAESRRGKVWDVILAVLSLAIGYALGQVSDLQIFGR